MKKGKLFISILWLVLAFFGIVGATFAWFSENRNVEAGGMQVQAETVKNLLISNAQSGTYDFSATSSIATNYSAKLTPVSTVPTLTSGVLTFYTPKSTTKANAIDYTHGTLKSGAEFETIAVTTSTPAEGSVYGAMKYTFYVKASAPTGKTMTNLYASDISVKHGDNDASANISKSLRIAVVCPSTGAVFFYSVTGGQNPYYGISGITNEEPQYTTEEVTALTSCTDASILAPTLTADTPVQVDIYVWYEGQDSHCTSTNSLTIEELSIAVTFSATDPEE